jgi:hypothetical protein
LGVKLRRHRNQQLKRRRNLLRPRHHPRLRPHRLRLHLLKPPRSKVSVTVKALAPPLMDGKGAPTRVIFIQERSLLFEFNAKRRKGAYLLIKKEGFSFVLKEEVSHDISFFIL